MSGNVVKFGRDERDFVYAIARRIVDSSEAAEDVAQDALLLAFRHRDSFRGDAKYRTWLYRIASTTALGYLRRGRRSREQVAAGDDSACSDMADPARSPEVVVADREAAGHARRVVDQLPPKYRDVVLMRVELTERETAKRLGISVANVKVRAHRARRQLKDALSRVPANDETEARPSWPPAARPHTSRMRAA